MNTKLLSLILATLLLTVSYAHKDFLSRSKKIELVQMQAKDGESESGSDSGSSSEDGESEGFWDWMKSDSESGSESEGIFNSVAGTILNNDGEGGIFAQKSSKEDYFQDEAYTFLQNEVKEESSDSEETGSYSESDGESSSEETSEESTEPLNLLQKKEEKKDKKDNKKAKKNDGETQQKKEKKKEKSESEGGFFDWLFDIFESSDNDGESSFLPSLPLDGEFITDSFSDATGTVTDTVGGVTNTVSENVNKVVDGEVLAMFIDIRTKKECKDPVQAKFGEGVWEQNWEGVWNFNETGDQYGVTYNGEFLPLVQFDEEGKGSLLFEDNCGLSLEDFYNNKEFKLQKVDTDYFGDNLIDGEYLPDIPNPLDGELEFFDTINPFNYVDDVFDFIPDLGKLNPFDGESYFQVVNPFNYTDGLFDGEFGLDTINPLNYDGEFLDAVNPLNIDGEFVDDYNPLKKDKKDDKKDKKDDKKDKKDDKKDKKDDKKDKKKEKKD